MEYSHEFAKRLIESAEVLIGDQKPESNRTVLYLSCVSCEISLKALLEEAGLGIDQLTRISHNIARLIEEISLCDFVVPEEFDYEPIAIRTLTVQSGAPNGTVGEVLASQAARQASRYPNEIRYGEDLKHFPPEVMLECARQVRDWCDLHKGKLKRR